MSLHEQLVSTGSKLPIPVSTNVSIPASYRIPYLKPEPVDERKSDSDEASIDKYIPPLQRNESYPGLNSIRANNENAITSCCFIIDKKLTIFFCQLTVGVALMFFCCYMLTIKDECDQQQPFLSLLTFIVGVFLPKESMIKMTR